MEGLGYFHFKRNETVDIVMIALGLALLFTLTFFTFASNEMPILTFLIFALVLLAVFFIRMCVMKLVAIQNGADFSLYMTRFDRFGLRAYDRISYVSKEVGDKTVHPTSSLLQRIFGEAPVAGEHRENKGIPMIFISFVLYILSLGLIIFPSVWRYHVNTIDRLFLGTQQYFETPVKIFYNTTISGYRIAKVIFTGFVVYQLLLLILKFWLQPLFGQWFWWVFFMIVWIAIIGVLPIPGTEGCDLWFCSRYAWITALTITLLGPVAMLVFTNPIYTVLSIIILVLMVLSVYTWKLLM